MVFTAALVNDYDVNDHASEVERCKLDFGKGEGLTQQAIILRNASDFLRQLLNDVFGPMSFAFRIEEMLYFISASRPW